MSTDKNSAQPLQQIVLASGNAGKIRELQQLFSDWDIEVLPQSRFVDHGADEIGLSFVENAILKARHACQHSGLPAIADDSGLEVDALMGQPGIHSARFAGEQCRDADNNRKLINALEGLTTEERSARFQCVLVFMRHADDPTPLICQGSWEGRILHQPSGEQGFGYDPLFFVPDQNCSAAELSREQKNAISHRGVATAQLLLALQQRYGLPARG